MEHKSSYHLVSGNAKFPWYMALQNNIKQRALAHNPIHVATNVLSGFHGTHVHTNADKWLQILYDVGSTACQGTWLGIFVLPLDRFHMLGHTRTPSQLVPGPLCLYIA